MYPEIRNDSTAIVAPVVLAPAPLVNENEDETLALNERVFTPAEFVQHQRESLKVAFPDAGAYLRQEMEKDLDAFMDVAGEPAPYGVMEQRFEDFLGSRRITVNTRAGQTISRVNTFLN